MVQSVGAQVIGGKPSSLKSQTLNQQVIADIPPRLTTTMDCCLKFQCMQFYTALELNLYFVLKILVVIGTCILCLWDIQLTFDLYCT